MAENVGMYLDSFPLILNFISQTLHVRDKVLLLSFHLLVFFLSLFFIGL